MLPFSGSVILNTPITLKAASEMSETFTLGWVVLSNNLILAELETAVLLAINQLVVTEVLAPGFTLSIRVQLPPLSKEYDTCTRLDAAWLQMTYWVLPTGAFCAPLNEVSFKLETMLKVPLVELILPLSMSETLTKASLLTTVGTCGQIKLVPLVTGSLLRILVQFIPPLVE